MSNTPADTPQPSGTDTAPWKRWLTPATMPGAVLAAVIGGLIVLAITASLTLL
jgi:hypothetical protein